MRVIVSLAAAALSLAVVNQSMAKVRHVNPNCPWIGGKYTWMEYVNDPAARINRVVPFQVHFDRNDLIGDTEEYLGEADPLGRVHAGAAYTIQKNYVYKRYVYGGYDERGKCMYAFKSSYDDLRDDQFQLFEEVFTFDNMGRVFHPEYGLVGTLYCTIRDGRGFQMKRYRPCK